jgi:hypothetical protein
MLTVWGMSAFYLYKHVLLRAGRTMPHPALRSQLQYRDSTNSGQTSTVLPSPRSPTTVRVELITIFFLGLGSLFLVERCVEHDRASPRPIPIHEARPPSSRSGELHPLHSSLAITLHFFLFIPAYAARSWISH